MCMGFADMGCGQSKVAASPEHSHSEKENNVSSKVRDSPEKEGYQILTYGEDSLPENRTSPGTPTENKLIAVTLKELNGCPNKLLEKAPTPTWRPFRDRANSGSVQPQSDENLEKPASLLMRSHISESQAEFFRILDEKIANGPDYESDEDK